MHSVASVTFVFQGTFAALLSHGMCFVRFGCASTCGLEVFVKHCCDTAVAVGVTCVYNRLYPDCNARLSDLFSVLFLSDPVRSKVHAIAVFEAGGASQPCC